MKYFAIAIAIVFSMGVKVYAGENCKTPDCSCGTSVDTVKAEANIKSSLNTLPLGVDKVKATPVQGIYEVIGEDGRIYYVDSKGQHMFIGQLVDLVGRKNLTAEAEAAIPKKIIDVAALPLDNAIKYTNGKTNNRKVFTFEDPDCGYCKKLHTELKALVEDGIDVYVFLFPLRDKTKSVSVWCSEDQGSSLNGAYGGKNVPTKTCDNPIDKNVELGRKLGVRGTPMVILDNGKSIPGYVPAATIKTELGS